MPEARALKTFHSRYGLIRAGTVFTCAPDYFKALAKNNLVAEEKPGEPGPSKNRNVPEAPGRSGKEPAAPGKSAPGTGQPPASGSGLTSASLRAGRASPKKTSPKSAGGAKKTEKPKAPAA
jgi:hypothetical protein